jgi:hypothetical protein
LIIRGRARGASPVLGSPMWCLTLVRCPARIPSEDSQAGRGRRLLCAPRQSLYFKVHL